MAIFNNMKQKDENPFARFFSQKDYITLKNQLFNYRFRKHMIAKAYEKYGSKNPKNKLLDIGCGISPVSPHPKQTTFIDSDVKAMNLLKELGHKTATGDVKKIPFGKNAIDAIFCSEVLEHVPDHKAAIKEFNRVLKKDSLLIITVPTHMKYWSFDDDYVGHLRRFDPDKLANELKSEGFKVLEKKPIGSLFEREVTKLLVRRAIAQKETNMNEAKMKLFKLINKLLFEITYLSYIFNTKSSSSIVLIVARKAD